jgi:hypothetical protein
VSGIEAKLSGVARLSDCSEAASTVSVPVSTATSATTTLIRIFEFIVNALPSQHGGR